MIACVAMVRDEADILPAFLAHAGALFDLVLVADHLSTDATPAILAGAAAAGLPVEAMRVRAPGHWQSAVTTALAREAFARGAAWVVPLDADEFLDIGSPAELAGALASGGSAVVNFRWRHAVPMAGAEGEGWPAPPWLANPEPAAPPLWKIALHRRVAERLPTFHIGMGNHALFGMAFAKAIAGPTVGTLWHLPVRSRAQFLGKLRHHLAAGRGPDGKPFEALEHSQGVKRRLLAALEARPEDEALLRTIALRYSEQHEACLDPAIPWPAPVPVTPRFVLGRLPSPAAPPPPPQPAPPLPAGLRRAEAVLSGGEIICRPAPASRQRIAALEGLVRRGTIPFGRLLASTAKRRVKRALGP